MSASDLPTDSVPANQNIPNSFDQKEVDNLLYLAEAINGPNTFDLTRATYGYVQQDYRLLIPASLKPKFLNKMVDSPEGKKFNFAQPDLNIMSLHAIAYWNYLRLRRAKMSETEAFFVATYRARLISLGYLIADREDRCVTVDEIDFDETALDFFGSEVSIPKPKQGDRPGSPGNEMGKAAIADNTPRGWINAYLAHGRNHSFKAFLVFSKTPDNIEIAKYVNLCAEQWAAAVYLVFRQHGHHWKEEFNMKYDILWKATTIVPSKFYPGHEAIMRIAVHSFGMKSFHERFYHNLGRDALAETFKDRADVAPQGVALIATCYAAINLMRSMSIWGGFYAAWRTQINELERYAMSMKGANAKDAIKYHRSAKLFGAVRVTPTKMIETAAALAPIAKGLIVALGESSDMSKQKALDKRANQNPIIVNTVARVLIKLNRVAVQTGDFNALVPKPVKGAPSKAKVKEVEEEESGEEEDEGEEETT